MMHLTGGDADRELLAELKEAGILTPDAIDRIDASLGRPEAGTLNEFLLAGAGIVRENDWLSWLIRRHGCHRFGRVAWHDEAMRWRPAGDSVGFNLPFRESADGHPMVAVLRPDGLPAAAQVLRCARPIWAAATLEEIRYLRSEWLLRTSRPD